MVVLVYAGGSLFLFDKAACRNFRQDGHNWEKKSDGNVKENHMKLKGAPGDPHSTAQTSPG